MEKKELVALWFMAAALSLNVSIPRSTDPSLDAITALLVGDL